MNTITQESCAQLSSKTGSFRAFRIVCVAAALGLAFAANAQISSINSVQVKKHVFDDAPGAIFSDIVNYPTEVAFSETNVSSASGFADRDVWYFSNNGGASSYEFQSNDFFSATFTIDITGGVSGLDLEGGFLFSDPSGIFGGDCQIFVVASGGVVFQGGGPSYYPFSPAAGGYPGAGGGVPNYVEGTTYTLTLNYVLDPNTGQNAFQYAVNGQYAASKPGDTYFDLGTNASGNIAIGNPGDALGAYFQIGTQTDSSDPANYATAVFGSLSIVPPPTLSILPDGNQSVIFYPAGNTNYVLQSTTNLSSPNWTAVTNGAPIQGIVVSNTLPASYYRLQFTTN